MAEVILEMKGITKRFPSVVALNKVDFNLYKQEIHGIFGENGAGKSTLIKILSGVYLPDEGKIILKKQEVSLSSPWQAKELGIRTIYQETELIPQLTIAENLYLGRLPVSSWGIVNWKKLHEFASQTLDEFRIHLDPDRVVRNLSVAEQQLVMIAKGLSAGGSILIMDEPTSSLTDQETRNLFSLIKRIRQKGVSIIYITHKLEETFEITSRITVLRDGVEIGTVDTNSTTCNEIIKMSIGRELSKFYTKTKTAVSDVALEVRDLCKLGSFKNISFKSHYGEILGLAGLVGAQRSRVANCIFGIETPDKGKIFLDGKKVRISHPRDAIRMYLGFVPEDRKLQGLILGMCVRENISLPSLSQLGVAGLVNKKKERALSISFTNKLSIHTPGIEQTVLYLSGGNQQKVVLAKWLALNPKVLILDEPTRGIDVETKEEIHRIMNEMVTQGISIILISSEMSEILTMSDRIIVMHEGKIIGEFFQKEATKEKLIQCMVQTSE